MHLEAMIEQVRRYVLGGIENANLEAEFKSVWRCTSRP